MRVVLLTLTLLLCSCHAIKPAASVVRVAAASDVRYVWDDLKAAFSGDHPSTQLTASFGSSGALFEQIRQKAPFDAFLSADSDYPRKLSEQGLAGKPSLYAIGQLALWAPEGEGGAPTMDGLASPSVRKISIANPAFAPYGRAAEAALKNAGVYDKVKAKLVLGENVSQAFEYVRSGNAEVGFIPYTVALANPGRTLKVPNELYPRIEQSAVVVNSSSPEAADFLSFLTGPRGRDILAKHGFALP